MFSEIKKMAVYLTEYELNNLLRRSKYFQRNKNFTMSNTTYKFIHSTKKIALIYYQFFLPEEKEAIEVNNT